MTRPAPGMAPDELTRETEHLARVVGQLEAHSRLAGNACVQLQLAVARRFIDRLSRPGPRAVQQPQWAKVQMQEVDEVLDDAEHTIELVNAGKLPSDGLGAVPTPTTGGAVAVRDGLLVAQTKTSAAEPPKAGRSFSAGTGTSTRSLPTCRTSADWA